MRMRYTVGLQDGQVLRACAETPGRVHGVPDSRSFVPGNETDVTELRSAQWYAGDGRNAYLHRAWMRRGLPANAFSGRPHIAIANTASDLTPCNSHLDEIAASVRDGIHEAGGIPRSRATAWCCSAAATRRSRRCSWRPHRWTCRPWSCPAARCCRGPSAA